MQSTYHYVYNQDASITIYAPHGGVMHLPSGDEAERFMELLSEYGTPWDVTLAVRKLIKELESKEDEGREVN